MENALASTADFYSGSVGIICTGGTFEKVYDPISERLVLRKNGVAISLISDAGLRGAAIIRVLHKDSLDLTPDDVHLIERSIIEAEQNNVVVIHGTSRLVETAMNMKSSGSKTVVFTGAMVPASVQNSDAPFNLGFAIACARTLPRGIWVAMNGEIFLPNFVIKDVATGRFEKIV